MQPAMCIRSASLLDTPLEVLPLVRTVVQCTLVTSSCHVVTMHLAGSLQGKA